MQLLPKAWQGRQVLATLWPSACLAGTGQWQLANGAYPMTAAVLRGSFDDATTGGHAPGDLRDAFLEAIDAFDAWQPGEPEPVVEVREQQLPISRICRLLWNCNDILPGLVWDEIAGNWESPPSSADYDGPKSRTYGAAARWLKEQIPD